MQTATGAFRRLVLIIFGLSMAGLLGAAPGASGGIGLRALADGKAIPLFEIADYHCHDLAYPVIKCFGSESNKDADLLSRVSSVSSVTDGLNILTLLSYVTFFADENYGGASFTASQSYSNLGDFGWNDRITSFKSLNGQRPRFWEDAGYNGYYWYWTAGAWVSNVGSGANDRFSSVKNVP